MEEKFANTESENGFVQPGLTWRRINPVFGIGYDQHISPLFVRHT